MENVFDQAERKVVEAERELAYWKEVLQKSEKYERLMSDPDFLGVLEDLGQTVRAHDSEVKKCLDAMSEYSPKVLEDAQHTIFVHQILKEQAQAAKERPVKILELAKEARKQIPMIEESIQKLKEEVHAA